MMASLDYCLFVVSCRTIATQKSIELSSATQGRKFIVSANMKIAYVDLRDRITTRARHHFIALAELQINPYPGNLVNALSGKQAVGHQAERAHARAIHHHLR
jgi:hypothetical protein